MSDLNDADPLDDRDKLVEALEWCKATIESHFTAGNLVGLPGIYAIKAVLGDVQTALSSRPDAGEAVAWMYERGEKCIIQKMRSPEMAPAWTEMALGKIHALTPISIDAFNPPDADCLKYEGDVIDAVQRLIEQGRATVDSEGYLVAHPPAAVGDYRELIAYNIIQGSAGIRAAEHAKDFKTSNWMDALRSADAVISAIFPQPAAPHPTDAQRIVEWPKNARFEYGEHLKGDRDE